MGPPISIDGTSSLVGAERYLADTRRISYTNILRKVLFRYFRYGYLHKKMSALGVTSKKFRQSEGEKERRQCAQRCSQPRVFVLCKRETCVSPCICASACAAA